MKYTLLNSRGTDEPDQKLNDMIDSFNQLTVELEKKHVPDAIVQSINTEIQNTNSVSGTAKVLRSCLGFSTESETLLYFHS